MRGREPYIRASVFDGLVQFVDKERLAIDVPALMREFGLDPKVTYSADAYVALAPVSHLLERAAVISGRPCFGLDYAAQYPVGASGSLGYLVTQAPTMRDALTNLVKFMPAFTSPMHIELTIDDGGVGYIEWMFPLEFTAAMPQYVSFALATVILRLRHIAGPTWTPLRVDLIHRELPCVDHYTSLFGSRVRFEAAHNRMWLDPTTLAISHTGPDNRIYRTAQLAGESELQVLAVKRPGRPPDIVQELRTHIEAVLADGAPELDQVAAALGHDARKLQYMLEQAKTSFSEEVSETRKLRAAHLLSATDQSMSEIAAALGFAEMSSFTRACRESWFGMAPSKYRQRVRAEGVPPPKTDTPASDDDTGAV
jgi:AraC-like DNA-binding protein